MTDTLNLVQALYEIVCESDEPETMRKALAALTNTEAGRSYLALNPLTL